MAFPDELLADGERTLLVTSPHGSEVRAPLIWLLAVVPCGGVLIEGAGEMPRWPRDRRS